ncbi:TPA: hypothetical protein HA265_07525 [Candidatus Woesearchaeota archaeon]|nr:hypothetical protein [Candidatus Woesearchaeota archaeon]
MVVHESFVTRRPIAFLVIMLGILVMIYLPVKYVIMPLSMGEEMPVTVNDTYQDTWRQFDQESLLTAEEKMILYETRYRGAVIEWQGRMMGCKDLDGVYSVMIKERNTTDYPDVVFSTLENCTARQTDLMIRYRMQIIDLNADVFVGKNGMIIA